MNLPDDWAYSPLSEICEINPRKSEMNNLPDSELVTFLGMADVGENGEIFNQNIRKLSDVKKNFTYFKRGDILFAKITPCMENGKGAIARIERPIGFGSTEFHVLRPKDRIISEWVYLFLSQKFIRRMAEKYMTGSVGQKRVSASFFQKIKISYPSIETQKKIVKIIKKSEQLKRLRKESDKLTDDYLNSVFLEMFGDPLINKMNWSLISLEKIAKKITDGEHNTPELNDFGIPYISAKNVDTKISFDDCKYVTEQVFNRIINRCNPEFDDILITCVGTIGRVKRIDIRKKFVFARSVALIKPNDSLINSIFLEKMLSLPNMNKYMTGETNEATVKGLYLKQIKKLKIPLPPKQLQEKFAKKAKIIERIKESQQCSKQQIDDLFNVLMQKAFRGELNC